MLSAGKFHECCLHNFCIFVSLGSFLIQSELKKNVNKGKNNIQNVLKKGPSPQKPHKTRAHVNNLKQDYGVEVALQYIQQLC